jgi:2-dehydro-3-deoxygluconokinase
MKKILTFGEILLRLSPEFGGKWINNQSIPTFIGGAELNVAAALSKWHVPVAYCSAMPNNALAIEIKNYLIAKNIDISPMQWAGERIGLYYLPQGADLKNEGVIYDRANSSFSDLKIGQIDWNALFEDVEWFHFSAISPALNQTIANICLEALKIAKSKKVKISVDLNYRAKLWKYGKDPVDIMPELASYCDLIMGNLWAANKLLGISIDSKIEKNNANSHDYIQHAKRTSEEIIQKFKSCKYVANTFRFDYKQNGISYFTTLFQDSQLYVSPEFQKETVVDKVGSGDCFMGGLLYGYFNKFSSQEIIDFAAAAAMGKLNEVGDFTNQTIEDVKEILLENELKV